MTDYAKPQPHNDAGDTLGTIHTKPEERDAIHLAVIQVQCQSRVKPGEHLRYLGNGVVETCDYNEGHGVADPFIDGWAMPNERFWLVLYPRQIRSLRHVWEHPAFESSRAEVPAPQVAAVQCRETDPEKLHKSLLLIGDPKAEAIETIRQIAQSIGASEQELMDAADSYVDHGEYWSEGGRFEGESIPTEFWPAYEVVTGKVVSENDKYSFLSCSC